MEKILSIGALVVALVALSISLSSSGQKLGGDVFNKIIDVQGLTVNGTTFVNSARAISVSSVTNSGAATSASMTVVNGTATSTVAVGSSAISTKVGKLCLWNGTQYSIISFAAGSTTVSVATSTSCQ